MKNDGRETGYRNGVKAMLNQIARATDLFNVESVKTYISTLQRKETVQAQLNGKIGTELSNGYKRRLSESYRVFCTYNKIDFKKPTYYYDAPIPLIPKTEDVNAIIANSPRSYAVIFQILAETAIEGKELSDTPNTQIDFTTGKISVVGVKRHDNGTYKLKPETAEMLRQYITYHNREHKKPMIHTFSKDPSIYPFPNRKSMSQTWVKARRKASKKLCQPHLNKIQMKSLRNYAGAIFYLTMGKDPIQTMHFMRHKKLEQTMDYLRGLTEFTATTEKITKIATTAEEAIELLNQGFKEEAIFGEKHLYTKMKY